jgi:hypothetical protein
VYVRARVRACTHVCVYLCDVEATPEWDSGSAMMCGEG